MIDKFGKENFEDYIYINLEKEAAIRKIFDESIDDENIISELELYLKRKINIENTLIFFDEVQVSERFIVSLKYFNESEKNYKIICAGSLLGVKINRFNSSFPVGKIKMEYMYPMNFEEFLIATGNEMLVSKIKDCYEKMSLMPDFAHEQALKLYRQYLCVGGMPEAVKNFVENDLDILKYDTSIVSNITEMYVADMKKYVKNEPETVKIEKIYKNIPAQLGKERKTFQYNLIEKDARKRKYEGALDWLVASGMILESKRLKKVDIPLKVYTDDDKFKLYLSDVGILTSLSEMERTDIMRDTAFLYKGAIVENYIAQEFKASDKSLYYWTFGRDLEINFILYNEDGIIPVEVKSSDRTKSTSLNTYIRENKPKYAIRLSTKNFGFENNIKSVPLYAAFCIK